MGAKRHFGGLTPLPVLDVASGNIKLSKLTAANLTAVSVCRV